MAFTKEAQNVQTNNPTSHTPRPQWGYLMHAHENAQMQASCMNANVQIADPYWRGCHRRSTAHLCVYSHNTRMLYKSRQIKARIQAYMQSITVGIHARHAYMQTDQGTHTCAYLQVLAEMAAAAEAQRALRATLLAHQERSRQQQQQQLVKQVTHLTEMSSSSSCCGRWHVSQEWATHKDKYTRMSTQD